MNLITVISSNYDANTTVAKYDRHIAPAIIRPSITNTIGQYAIIYQYDPIDRDYVVVRKTSDINEIRSYHRATRAGYAYQIEFKFPGAYRGTASELRWCDTCATKEPIFTVKYEEGNILPF